MARGGIEFNIEVSDVDRKAILSELKHMPDKMMKAERAAVSKTMRTAETRIAQNITKVANLKSKTVKERISRKKTPTNMAPNGILTIRAGRIPLWDFSRSMSDLGGFQSQKGIPVAKRKPKTGAGWKIYKSEKRIRKQGFFTARNTKDSQIEIMRRKPGAKGGNNAVPGRDYRIAYGLSLVEIMRRKSLYVPTLNDIADVLEKNLRNQVDRFLKRSKKDRPNAR